ncbi:MAG: Mitochondrial inner membrane protein oxa1 [Peltula sp. TS41687]|nr:MAG: Mitochondrial inner membrane protein oxa1 [Peltula sp. TS41687]
MDPEAESEPRRNNLSESITIPSDSESYAVNNEPSSSPPSSSNSPIILYSPPTIWSILRGAAINLILPFVNGLMLGFGELLAHEAAFRLGWGGTKFSRIATTNPISYQQLASQCQTSCLRSSWRPKLAFEPPRISPLFCARLRSTAAEIPILPVNAAVEIPIPAANTASPPPPPPPPQPEPGDTFSHPDLDSATRLSTEDLASIPEQIGYLKALGLDFGWGPTAMMQWLLEHIHIWMGTPWWLSIALSALALRLAFFKLYVDAADTSGRMAAMKPLTQGLLNKMKQAQVERDTPTVLRIKSEMNSVYARAGIKVWKAFIPAIQIPFGYGSFRLLRNMSALPVPGLETGGLLWLRDLTIPDPWFGLPILTGMMFYRNLKTSVDTGTTPFSSTTMRLLTYGLPVLTLTFMLNWPAAVQITFFVSMVLATIQSFLFRQPRFRRWAGISPLPRGPTLAPVASAYPGKLNLAARYQAPSAAAAAEEKMPKPEGIIGGAVAEVKGMGTEMKKSWRKLKGEAPPKKPGERTEAEKRQAAAYERRRQKELKQQQREIEHRRREDWWGKQERGGVGDGKKRK